MSEFADLTVARYLEQDRGEESQVATYKYAAEFRPAAVALARSSGCWLVHFKQQRLSIGWVAMGGRRGHGCSREMGSGTDLGERWRRVTVVFECRGYGPEPSAFTHSGPPPAQR
jgi:hypothetical protein